MNGNRMHTPTTPSSLQDGLAAVLDTVHRPGEQSYSNSYEAKRIELIRTALAAVMQETASAIDRRLLHAVAPVSGQDTSLGQQHRLRSFVAEAGHSFEDLHDGDFAARRRAVAGPSFPQPAGKAFTRSGCAPPPA